MPSEGWVPPVPLSGWVPVCGAGVGLEDVLGGAGFEIVGTVGAVDGCEGIVLVLDLSPLPPQPGSASASASTPASASAHGASSGLACRCKSFIPGRLPCLRICGGVIDNDRRRIVAGVKAS